MKLQVISCEVGGLCFYNKMSHLWMENQTETAELWFNLQTVPKILENYIGSCAILCDRCKMTFIVQWGDAHVSWKVFVKTMKCRYISVLCTMVTEVRRRSTKLSVWNYTWTFRSQVKEAVLLVATTVLHLVQLAPVKVCIAVLQLSEYDILNA
jgi:hypothetical protein